jgi:hypothetical protein
MPGRVSQASARGTGTPVVFVHGSYTVDTDGATKSGKVRRVPLVGQAARALDELSRRERWTSREDLGFVHPVGRHVETPRFAGASTGRSRRRTCHRSASTAYDTPSA